MKLGVRGRNSLIPCHSIQMECKLLVPGLRVENSEVLPRPRTLELCLFEYEVLESLSALRCLAASPSYQRVPFLLINDLIA